jgi:hypothetical protein
VLIVASMHSEDPHLVVSVLGSCYSRCEPICIFVFYGAGVARKPHPVVSVLGSCYSRQDPPTSSTGAMSYAVCAVAVIAQTEPPPRCFGSG